MQLLDEGRGQEAKTLLEALVASYPDSANAPRAKSALDDLWYAEGGMGPRQEADFNAGGNMIFFPPLAESADKSSKI